jgi:hypothetical protein
VFARDTLPPIKWPDSGWTKISDQTLIKGKQDVKLNSGGTRYRYYLLWITSLGGHNQLAIGEVTLYR